jgi:hypothetical protein
MCAVYSEIREYLAQEEIPLQKWIQFAAKHLGIIGRDQYLAAFGWELVQLPDGTHTVQRTAMRHTPLLSGTRGHATNGLGLFMSCLNDGLPIANPLPIIAKLSDLAKDMICVSTQPGTEKAPTTNTMAEFRQFTKMNPQLAMAALFEVPVSHPLITHGVMVQHLPTPNATTATTEGAPVAEASSGSTSGMEQQSANPGLDELLYLGPEPAFLNLGDGVPPGKNMIRESICLPPSQSAFLQG